MADADAMGLTPDAAQGYEDFFVPAIFHQWPPVILKVLNLSAGDHVLDVGCGTGVFTREAVKLVGNSGSATGLDLSDSMLGVARRIVPEADFHQGDVAALPFDADRFDCVVSAFALMFVPDQKLALQEMWRVLRPGGRLLITVWEALDANPAYAELVTLTADKINESAAESMAWPFALGDRPAFSTLLGTSGISNAHIEAHPGRARFASIEAFVRTEFESWLLAEDVSEAAIREVVDAASDSMHVYCDASGALDIPFNAVIATADKPAD